MKDTARIINRKGIDYLFFHLLDGFDTTRQGIVQLKNDGLITASEYVALVEKNQERLVERIKEFKIVNRIVSVLFAVLFSYMQMSGEDLDMRKPARGGRGRRRNETTQTI